MKYVALVTVDVGYLGSEPPPEAVAELIALHLDSARLETIQFHGTKVLTVAKVEQL